MGKKFARITIPASTRQMVKDRQKGTCCCCIESTNLIYHHIIAVANGGSNLSKNIVLLCKNHHKKLHLGDLDTCINIAEYSYYLQNKKLPDSTEELNHFATRLAEAEQ